MNDKSIRISPHAAFWLVFLVICVLVLVVFSQILLPFAAGFVAAYLFHPLVDRAQRGGLPRTVAAFVIVGAATLTFAAIIAFIVPILLNQLGQLIQALPPYIEKSRAYFQSHYAHYLEPFRQNLGIKATDEGGPDLNQKVAEHLVPWVLNELQSLLSSGLAFFNTLALLFISPVVAFFMLRDWDRVIEGATSLLPRQDSSMIRLIATEIDLTISGYLRGTLTVLLIVSGFYMAALSLIGLNYGVLIGLGAGMFSFVPYLGSIGGFFVAGAVATAQYWPNYTPIALVLIVFVFGQVVEGNILTPNIVGNKIKLHPVWLLFALIASGYLLGFTGLLISVPLAAVIGVLVRHGMRLYFESDLYKKQGTEDEAKILAP
jgi:predicted PurR-regulated permease PerM